MTDHPTHLSPDELDLWLDGRLSVSRMSHLETCEECHTAAEETREIVSRLANLPKPSLGPRFADVVMASVRVNPIAQAHLTADDLDAWLDGTLAGQPRAHLMACVECRRLADAERGLVYRLEQLPLLSPAPRFADRVMSGIRVPVAHDTSLMQRWGARVRSSRRAAAWAAALGTIVVGSMGASVAWSLTHQETIRALETWLTTSGSQLAVSTARAALASVTAQPWYNELRASATPARLVGLGALAAALYAGGLLALRRLLALPEPGAARAVS